MPPAPPLRNGTGSYHFHVYDYDGSAAAGPFQLSPAAGNGYNWPFYSMVRDLEGLAAYGESRQVPNIAAFETGAPTTGDRRTMVLRFGNAGRVPGRPVVLITGGLHAKEWAGTEMAYLMAEYLIRNYNPVPVGPYQQAIKDLVDAREIRVLPMLNPDGNYHTVMAGIRLWRKNRRQLPVTGAGWVGALTTGVGPNPPFTAVQAVADGVNVARYNVPDYDPDHRVPPAAPRNVRPRDLDANQRYGTDLNRNYPTLAWGYDTTPDYNGFDPSSETYFGTKAGGEIETRNVQQYLSIFSGIAAAIDYHAYGKMILFAPETFNSDQVRRDYRRLGVVLRNLVRAQDEVDYRLGTPLPLYGYEGTGSISDFLAQRHRARTFTIEVDPAYPTTPKSQGFILPQTHIMRVFEKNVRGVLAAIAAPTLGVTSAQRRQRRQEITASQARFLAWDVYGRGNQLPV